MNFEKINNEKLYINGKYIDSKSNKWIEVENPSTGEILGRVPKASDDEIREYLIGNLCRCTGYESQLRGVRKFLEGGL